MPDQLGSYRVDAEWVNANTDFTVEKGKALDGYNNYYNLPEGVEPALFVKQYEDITLKDVWDGIDIHYFGSNGFLEADYIVAPGADYRNIQIQFKGADLSADEKGNLIIKTPFGEIREGALKVYQNNERIAAKWNISEDNVVSFSISNYNAELALRIDPVTRVWGTYYGGNGADEGYNIATDAEGNVMATGVTRSTNFISIATTGAHQTIIGGSGDLFVVKFNGSGIRLWGTYYGGGGIDEGRGIATDLAGNVLVTGKTSSTNSIATAGAHQTTSYALFNGSNYYDAFVLKFFTNGILLWGTYYGGAGLDAGTEIATDAVGNVLVTGETASFTGIATTGAHQTSYDGQNIDAFIVKFNAAGTRLWATYYGGSLADFGEDIAIDASGNILVTGRTNSTNSIATTGAHQTSFGGALYDAFVVKFDASGNRLWGTYYGGNNYDVARSIVADPSNNVLVTGNTLSTNAIATSGAHQSIYGGTLSGPGGDAFVVKFDVNGNRLWGTYYGDACDDLGEGITTDASGNVFVTGTTCSKNAIATTGAYQTTIGGIGLLDAFLVKFNSSGIRLAGSYYGGGGYDWGYNITCDALGNLLVIGSTSGSESMATTGAHQTSFGLEGYSDAFVVKFDKFTCCAITTPSPNTCGFQDGSISGQASGGLPPYSFLWSNGSTESSIQNLGAGTYTLTITDSEGCTATSSSTVVNSTEPLLSFTGSNFTPGNSYGVSWSNFSTGSIVNLSVSNDDGSNWVNLLTNQAASGFALINLPANLASGNWILRAKASNGCSATSRFVTTIAVKQNRIEFYQNVQANATANANNIIAPGLPLRFKLRVQNNFSTNLLTLSGTIRSQSPWVQIRDSVATYNNILVNQQAWGTDEFEIYILPGAPAGTVATLELWMKDQISTGGPWGSTFSIILTPPFQTNFQIIDDDTNPDSNGDNDDIAEPGETVEIIPLLINNSALTIHNTSAQLVSLFPSVSVWNNVQGANTIVKNTYSYQYAAGVWSPVQPMESNLVPEEDFVFKYNFAQTFGINFSLLVSGYPNMAAGTSWDIGGVLHRWNAPFKMNNGYPNTYSITALNCASTTNIGNLMHGSVASGVSSIIPYTGGNGGPHDGQTIASTGVTGLTATLVPGFFANGSGSLTYIITGTPSSGGTASFALNIGGRNCTLTRTINIGGSGPIIIEMGLIPSGTFTMGSPSTEPGRVADELQHQVTLSAYRMSKYEISNSQYAVFLNAKGIGSNGIYIAGTYPTRALIYENASLGLTWTGTQWQPVAGKENFPVVNVTWYGATEFATYAGGRLPTEAEWEYACRGNTTTRFNTGACINNTQANYFWLAPLTGCTNTSTAYPNQTQAINSYSPNAYGLFNMHGNVWEWCSDRYGAYSTTAQTNPTGQSNGENRVLRGGSWGNEATGCRSAHRDYFGPDGFGEIGGFRLAFAYAQPNDSITALTCSTATNAGTLTKGVAASGVSSSVPYTGGNGGSYSAQTVTSTGVNGLTANLVAGTLATGAGNLTYTISGTPAANGTASFALSIGGQTCSLTRTVVLPAGTITALTCSTATNAGTLTKGVAASGVSSSVPYTGGNGGSYSAQTVTSTGVNGLTANLVAGTLATGAGNLTYTISGTPAANGTASFALNIGGKTCTLSRTIVPAGSISLLNTVDAINSGILISGVAASGVSSSIPYTGGNGGTYTAQTFSSEGITGLTASLAAGTFANGAGSLNFIISGTPSSIGQARFYLNFGGISSVFYRWVSNAGISSGTTATCGATNVHNPVKSYGTMIDQQGNVYKTVAIGT